jgi:secreted Zn-dependent insulinase-like peptidase
MFSVNNGLAHMFYLVPEKDYLKLQVVWPNLTNKPTEWHHKNLMFLGNAIGHEGPNSLLSELIAQGLATTLMTDY